MMTDDAKSPSWNVQKTIIDIYLFNYTHCAFFSLYILNIYWLLLRNNYNQFNIMRLIDLYYFKNKIWQPMLLQNFGNAIIHVFVLWILDIKYIIWAVWCYLQIKYFLLAFSLPQMTDFYLPLQPKGSVKKADFSGVDISGSYWIQKQGVKYFV